MCELRDDLFHFDEDRVVVLHVLYNLLREFVHVAPVLILKIFKYSPSERVAGVFVKGVVLLHNL